jgi:activating signal cointegrator 1
MRAISLWQPWATAIAVGNKRVETRHWTTRYRGPLAIHAAKRWGPDQREFASVEHALGRLPARVPLGVIVATCRLVDIRPTQELHPTVSAVERLYGNYEWGRFGWLLEDVVALPEPIPFKGGQGFFDVPDVLLGHGAAMAGQQVGMLL